MQSGDRGGRALRRAAPSPRPARSRIARVYEYNHCIVLYHGHHRHHSFWEECIQAAEVIYHEYCEQERERDRRALMKAPPTKLRIFEYNHGIPISQEFRQILHDNIVPPTSEPSDILNGSQGPAHPEAGSDAPPNNHAAPPNDDDIQYLGTSKLPELPPMEDNVDPYVLELVKDIIEQLKTLPQDSEEFLSLRRRLDVPYMRAALHKYNRTRPPIRVEEMIDHSDEEPEMPPAQQQQQQPLKDQQPPTTTSQAAASGVGGLDSSQPQSSGVIPSQLTEPPVPENPPSRYADGHGPPALLRMTECYRLRDERLAQILAGTYQHRRGGPPPP